MLKLATILDNPGEPVAETQYRDPQLLRELGYNGVVLFETTGLSGLEELSSVSDPELRHWIEGLMQNVRQGIERATAAGLDTYLVFDTLSLAAELVDRHGESVTCQSRPNLLCPASDQAFELSVRSLEHLLGSLPEVAGVVLRFGDNAAPGLPYLIGNDIYSAHCPRCASMGRADRIEKTIHAFHALVVEKLNKRLIARAWNVRPGGLHDTAELCSRVQARLPGEPTDDRLVLSFKFTESDFWRYQRWNPASLTCGDRPILYELECQREFEGKGSIPNWQPSLWRNGPPEIADDAARGGLATVVDKVNLAGLWAWVRGGGWGGPFVRDETWIDANVYAVPRLADQPDLDLGALAQDWVSNRLGIDEPEVVDVLSRILLRSADIALAGFYVGPYARSLDSAWHPNADWIQDDLVNADAAWRIIRRLRNGDLDEAIREKRVAVDAISELIQDLSRRIHDGNRRKLEPLVHSMMYAESLFEALRDLLAGLGAYRRYTRSRDTEASEACRQRLLAAQSHWNHHTQRHASLAGAASAFREHHFWDLTQRLIGEVST